MQDIPAKALRAPLAEAGGPRASGSRQLLLPAFLCATSHPQPHSEVRGQSCRALQPTHPITPSPCPPYQTTTNTHCRVVKGLPYPWLLVQAGNSHMLDLHLARPLCTPISIQNHSMQAILWKTLKLHKFKSQREGGVQSGTWLRAGCRRAMHLTVHSLTPPGAKAGLFTASRDEQACPRESALLARSFQIQVTSPEPQAAQAKPLQSQTPVFST